MDILANAVMMDDQSSPLFAGRVDFREQDYPIPAGGSRFILPVSLRQALQEHPLSRDLYLASAGFSPHDTRRFPGPSSPCYLLQYCLGGKVRVITAARSWSVTTGDLAVIPPNLNCVIDAASPSSSYFWVTYFGELSTSYTEFLNAADVVVHLGLQPEIIAQFEALCELRTSNFTLDTFIHGANRLKVLMTSISLALAQKANHGTGRLDLERVRKFMAQRLDGPLNLEELADSVNLSSYHFARIFKKLTGQSPMRYFAQMRLQQACYLLDTTRQSIKQVAHAVGYADPQYFSRVFRQLIGMTPQAYRSGSSSVSGQNAASQ